MSSASSKDLDSNKNDSHEPRSEKKDLDYILDHIVGGFGPWQIRSVLSMCMTFYIGTYVLLVGIFTLYEPRHRCYVSECDDFMVINELSYMDDNLNFYVENITQDWAGFAIPKKVSSQTLTSRLNLVCENAYKRDLVTACLIAGMLVGSVFGSRCVDRFGRKGSLLASTAVTVPTMLAGAFCPHLEAYATLRFLGGLALPVIGTACAAYGIEVVGRRHRKYTRIMYDYTFAHLLLALIAHLTRHWQWLHICLAIVCLTFSIPCFFIPESPRWLSANGKTDEAIRIFESIAKGNGKDLSLDQIKEIRDIVNQVEPPTQHQLSLLDMFRHGQTAKTLNVMLQWITLGVSYYALTLNISGLHGDPVLNFVIGTVVDMTSTPITFFAMDGLGRRWTLFSVQAGLAVSTVAMAFAPRDMPTLIQVFYFIGRITSLTGGRMALLATSELYPTNMRAQAIGFCSMASRIFSLIAGFVPSLEKIWQPLPMLLLGVPSLAAAGLALALPETRGAKLPQNLADVKEMKPGVRMKNSNEQA